MKPRERRRYERWNPDHTLWMAVATTLVCSLLALLVMMGLGALIEHLI